MKKIIVILLLTGIGAFTSNLSAQENSDAKTQEAKKGGFGVGGFDASRQESAKSVKRSVNLNDEAEVSEKAVMEYALPSAQPVEAMPSAASSPATRQKEGNANGKIKQKPKNNSKSKGKRR
jgi:hypothetical protein